MELISPYSVFEKKIKKITIEGNTLIINGKSKIEEKDSIDEYNLSTISEVIERGNELMLISYFFHHYTSRERGERLYLRKIQKNNRSE